MEIEKKLRTSLTEKEVMLREIHHRVGNNLQIIVSLINLKSNSTENKECFSVLETIRQRVYALSSAYQTLLSGSSLSVIRLDHYLPEIANSIILSCVTPKINLRLDFQKVEISLKKAVPCGLLISELLDNSVKHAFPGKTEGTVFLEIAKIEDEIRITLSDNGIGLKNQAENRTHMGIMLARTLAEQMKGRLEEITDKGTCWILRIPATD